MAIKRRAPKAKATSASESTTKKSAVRRKKAPVVEEDADDDEEEEEEEEAPAPKKSVKKSKKAPVVEEEDDDEVEDEEEEDEVEDEEEEDEVEDEVEDEEEEDEVEEAPAPKKTSKKASKKAPKKTSKKAPTVVEDEEEEDEDEAPKSRGKIQIGSRRNTSSGVTSEFPIIDGTSVTISGTIAEPGHRFERKSMVAILHEVLEARDLTSPSLAATARILEAVEDTFNSIVDHESSFKFAGSMFKVTAVDERIFGAIIEGAQPVLVPAHKCVKFQRSTKPNPSIKGEIDEDGNFTALEEKKSKKKSKKAGKKKK